MGLDERRNRMLKWMPDVLRKRGWGDGVHSLSPFTAQFTLSKAQQCLLLGHSNGGLVQGVRAPFSVSQNVMGPHMDELGSEKTDWGTKTQPVVVLIDVPHGKMKTPHTSFQIRVLRIHK